MTGRQNNKNNNIENMKTLIKLVLAAAMFTTAAAVQAQVDIYGTSTTIGDFTFHNYSTSDGGYVSGTTTIIGDTAFSDFSASGGYGSASLDISGTSTAIGNVTFHDYSTSDGDTISGDSITIGDTTFTDLSEW
jgi:cytoskeletal protein CcmA (bactofilin family)